MQSRVCAAACVALLSVSSAHAADAPAVLVTATRFEALRQSLPVGALIVTARDLEASGATNLPEALARLGGVLFRNVSGDPSPQIDLRGFGATGDQNTLILLNGLRISENEQATARLSAIPIESIERIEILPGAGAVLYGGGATGGTINIITREPGAGERAIRMRANAGSHSTGGVGAGVTLSGERSGLILDATGLESEGYRANSALREQNLSGEARLRLSGGALRARFGSARQRLGLPGSLTEAQIAADRRAAANPDDFGTLETWHASLGGEIGGAWGEFAVEFGARNRASDANFVSFGGRTVIDADVRSVTPRMRLPYAAGPVQGELVVGLDWYDWDYQRNVDIPAFFFASRVVSTQEDRALYFHNGIQLPEAAHVSFGAREQRTEIVQEELLGFPGRQSQQLRLRAFDIGVRKSFGEAVSIHGRWGQSFRAANVDDNGFTLTGELLSPQTSHDAELGLETAFSGARMRATLFESRVSNEIHFIAILGGGGFNGANVNLPPTRHRGIELDASWRAGRDLTVSANYRHTRARFRDGVFFGTSIAGNEVPLVPRHRAGVSATWRGPGGFLLSGGVRYVGSQRHDNDQVNTYKRMPAYTVADLKVSRRIGPWSLSAVIDNLFGEKYHSYAIRNAAGTSFNAYPEAERRVLLSVEYLAD